MSTINANFVSVCQVFFVKQPEVNTCQQWHPDSLRSTVNRLYKLKKTVDGMNANFTARPWTWPVLFDLVRRIYSAGNAKRLSGSDRCRQSELIQTKSINVNCSQDGQPTTESFFFRLDSGHTVNSETLACCHFFYSVMTFLNMLPLLPQVVALSIPVQNKEYLISVFKLCPLSIKFWTFWRKLRYCINHGCKMMAH